jgi:hypothetical protein
MSPWYSAKKINNFEGRSAYTIHLNSGIWLQYHADNYSQDTFHAEFPKGWVAQSSGTHPCFDPNKVRWRPLLGCTCFHARNLELKSSLNWWWKAHAHRYKSWHTVAFRLLPPWAMSSCLGWMPYRRVGMLDVRNLTIVGSKHGINVDECLSRLKCWRVLLMLLWNTYILLLLTQ